MNIALITISTLSLVTSSATLIVMLVGAKKMQAKGKELEAQVEQAKATANTTVRNLKHALNGLEI